MKSNKYTIGVREEGRRIDELTVIIKARSHGEALLKTGIMCNIRFDKIRKIPHLIYYVKSIDRGVESQQLMDS